MSGLAFEARRVVYFEYGSRPAASKQGSHPMTENHTPAAGTPGTQATPTNYDGWLALLAPEGQGPGIYRITRTRPSEDNGHSAGCEDCGKTSDDSIQPFYRWVELHDVGYPLELGICQGCLETQVAAGMPHDEPIDPDGARCHFYPPTSTVERMRAAHRAR